VPLLFVFDMDDVLYRYDWRTRMAGMTALTGIELAELRRRWWNPDGEWKAEAGGFPDGAAYHRALVDALGVEVSVDDWVANRASAMTADPESLDAVRRAAELGRVSLLTNNGPLLGEHLERIAPELAEIIDRDHLRTSSYYGARKPDQAVFLAVLQEYGADPADVFFADDLPENVAGAESVGITAHLFTSGRALRDAIEEFARSRTPGG
jgi:putative hydrolase of the HAD superfamily